MKTALPFLVLAVLVGCGEPPIDVEVDGGSDASQAEPDDVATGRPKAIFTLTVTRSGTGTGSVRGTNGTATPIDCGSDCSELVILPTTITLTALPSTATSVFAGWTGGCTGLATTCTVTVGPAGLDVDARFDLAPRTLRILKAGNGIGNVTARRPDGSTLVSCQGSACSANAPHGTVLTLTATPNADARFAGWSGACTGTATTCTVTMDRAQDVTARFIRTVRLEVVVIGSGGRVRFDPVRPVCPAEADGFAVCTYTHDAGARVTVIGSPSSLGRFRTGPCRSDEWSLEGEFSCPLVLNNSTRIDVEFSRLTL